MEQEISFSEIAAIMLSLRREDVVFDIVNDFSVDELGPKLDARVQVDKNFVEEHGDSISNALNDQVCVLVKRDAGEALNFMVYSMQILTQMSITANKISMGRGGNYVLKNIASWKNTADIIKRALNAHGYTIGANLGLGLGVYIEMHF